MRGGAERETAPGRSPTMTERDDGQERAPRADDGPTYDAEGARQGHIVLRSKRRRAIFVGGLAGLVVLALVLALAA